MSKINLNDLDKYVETHQPIQKIRKKRKLKDQEFKPTDKGNQNETRSTKN